MGGSFLLYSPSLLRRERLHSGLPITGALLMGNRTYSRSEGRRGSDADCRNACVGCHRRCFGSSEHEPSFFFFAAHHDRMLEQDIDLRFKRKGSRQSSPKLMSISASLDILPMPQKKCPNCGQLMPLTKRVRIVRTDGKIVFPVKTTYVQEPAYAIPAPLVNSLDLWWDRVVGNPGHEMGLGIDIGRRLIWG
jgi:hypothetical protein